MTITDNGTTSREADGLNGGVQMTIGGTTRKRGHNKPKTGPGKVTRVESGGVSQRRWEKMEETRQKTGW